MPSVVVAIAFVLVVAGCSGSGASPGSTEVADSPPSTSIPRTTTVATTATTITAIAAPTTSVEPATPPLLAMGSTEVEPRLLGIGDEYFPFLGNPGYDVHRYDLNLSFDPAVGFLEATVTITAIAVDELRTFNLDFDRLTVDALFVDGVEVPFVHADEELTIRPPEPINTGEVFVVEIAYSGVPGPEPTRALPIDVGWFTSVDGSEAFVLAEPENAHTWFPSNDHPLDKATFEFAITVPDGLLAAANGSLVSISEADDGRTTYTWEMDDPMATYLATVVIGEFDLVEDDAAAADAGIPIRHVLPRGTTVANWPGLERQGEILRFLEGIFGPYPFDEYGIAIIGGDFPTALENQTLSVFSRLMTNPELFERILVHEAAHQWFGNSVGLGLWRDIWLNEGFASYAEWLWLEHELGGLTLDDAIEVERIQLAGAGLRPPGDPLVSDLFNITVYRVGAMTLHALRLTVGDDTFFETLRAYHQRFAGGTATTMDFVEVAEKVSGADLKNLFESWLFGDEIPAFP